MYALPSTFSKTPVCNIVIPIGPVSPTADMRFSVILPILISVVAFVLSILVVLAGRNANFLTDTYIIKVIPALLALALLLSPKLTPHATQLDTSNIGKGNINIPDTGIAIIDNAIDNAGDGVVGQVVQTAAKVLGIHDFYTAQVMGYCEGTGGDGSPSVVTNCTSGPMFTFNPVAIMEDELRIAGGLVTLEDLGFPTGDVNNALRALNAVYQVMFVAYCIGIATAGLCIIIGFLGFIPSRLMACVNWLVASVCSPHQPPGYQKLQISNNILTVLLLCPRRRLHYRYRARRSAAHHHQLKTIRHRHHCLVLVHVSWHDLGGGRCDAVRDPLLVLLLLY